jgi:hypothetical protein
MGFGYRKVRYRSIAKKVPGVSMLGLANSLLRGRLASA